MDRLPEPYRPVRRGAAWREVSLAVRVEAGRCECCQRPMGGPARLQAAHLFSEIEMWAMGPGLREAYLLDRRGLVALCKPCHGAFDTFGVRVRDPRWLDPRRLARLWLWRQRPQVADGLRRLGRRRAQWLATLLREADGTGGTDGAAGTGGRGGGAGERAADSE